MKLGTIVLLVVCAAHLTTRAQNKAPAPGGGPASPAASGTLQSTAAAKIPLVGTLVGNGRCDDAGNIYVRFMDAEMNKMYHGISKIPIEKINPDGSLASTFRITDAFADIWGKDFFVSGNGQVYQAGFMPNGAVYVTEFANRGSVRSKIRLSSTGFVPYQIVAFRSGEFLLSGTTGLSNGYRPFTGVFDAQGRLLKEIYEPEDEDSRRRAEAGEPDFVPDGTNSGNAFVWHGDAALGSDGNAYLLRATSPALVYVISSKGEVLRKLRIDPPGTGLVARGVKPAAGRLAISFLNRGMITGMVKVVDLQGVSIATYSSDSLRTPGLPGCYVSGGFIFLDDDPDHNLYLRRAEPK
jgi:hypothetical protein